MEESPHRKGFNKSKGPLVLLLLLVLVFAVYSFWLNPVQNAASSEAAVNANGYQAIFLANKEEYFGKLTVGNRFYILRDIYYLKTGGPSQPAEGAEENIQIQLRKFGNEIHGPEDVMFIEKEQVLYWENLKDTSNVVSTIKRHKAQPQTPAAPAPAKTTPTEPSSKRSQ